MGTFVTVRFFCHNFHQIFSTPGPCVATHHSPLTPQLPTLWHWIDLGVHRHRVGRELEMEGLGHEPLRPSLLRGSSSIGKYTAFKRRGGFRVTLFRGYINFCCIVGACYKEGYPHIFFFAMMILCLPLPLFSFCSIYYFTTFFFLKTKVVPQLT